MNESADGRARDRSLAEAERIAALWHGVRLHLPRGQFLVYAGHVPTGVHVLVAGALEATGSDECAEAAQWDVAAGALVIPPPSRLHVPATWTLRIVEVSDLVFFPRETIETDPELARALQQLVRAGAPHA